MGRTKRLAILLCGLVMACDPVRTRPPGPSTVRDASTVETAQPLAPVTPDASAPVLEARPPENVAPRADRVAALSPMQVFALTQGTLRRVENGRWKELPVAGLSLRDVTASHGFIWVLGRGVGPNAGVTTVLRSTGADDLAVAATATLDDRWEPRVLDVARHGEFYVGGSDPPLVRLRGPQVAATVNRYPLPKPVTDVMCMPGDVVILRYNDGARVAFRWGEVMPIGRENYLTSFLGMREMLTLTRDGTVWRGIVWELAFPAADRLTSSPGFTPALVTMLRDGRIMEVAEDGRTKVHNTNGWSTVESPAVEEPVALLGVGALTRGLALLADRAGRVYEFDGTRWVLRIDRFTQ